MFLNFVKTLISQIWTRLEAICGLSLVFLLLPPGPRTLQLQAQQNQHQHSNTYNFMYSQYFSKLKKRLNYSHQHKINIWVLQLLYPSKISCQGGSEILLRNRAGISNHSSNDPGSIKLIHKLKTHFSPAIHWRPSPKPWVRKHINRSQFWSFGYNSGDI